MWYNSNMTSFIGYIHNTMIKLIIYFNSHMPIDDQITIIYLSLGIKNYTKIMLPMLKLDANYGFHELFLN